MARPGRALQVGDKIDFLFFKLSRRGAEHVDHGIESRRQIGVAVRQSQGLQLVHDFAGVVTCFRDDASGRRCHEEHTEAVAAGRIFDQPDRRLPRPIKARAISRLEGHAERAVDHQDFVSSPAAGLGPDEGVGK